MSFQRASIRVFFIQGWLFLSSERGSKSLGTRENKITFIVLKSVHLDITAKHTEHQKSLTILADRLVMQSVSRQFEFLWKSVLVTRLLTQSKHPDWPDMVACWQQSAARHYSQYSLYIDTSNKANWHQKVNMVKKDNKLPKSRFVISS